MMDQVDNRNLEIVLVIEMRGDTQKQILAHPNEITGIVIYYGVHGSEGIGGPTAKLTSDNASWSILCGI
jgi:hypothetical protein